MNLRIPWSCLYFFWPITPKTGCAGYNETFRAIVANTTVNFTPNPHFTDISERWAAVIRDIANGMYGSTQEGMDALKIWMDDKLSKVEVE